MDRRLERNPLKGALSDAMHSVMFAPEDNLRSILASLQLFSARLGLSMSALFKTLIAVPAVDQTVFG
jgi:hypothetical protein